MKDTLTLYEECLLAIGDSYRVLSEEETKKLFHSLELEYPFTVGGRIKWESTPVKIISDPIDIEKKIKDYSEQTVFILWDNSLFTAIETKLNKVLEVIDDVTAVSFDTWLYSPSQFVIEFHHDGEIVLGSHS